MSIAPVLKDIVDRFLAKRAEETDPSRLWFAEFYLGAAAAIDASVGAEPRDPEAYAAGLRYGGKVLKATEEYCEFTQQEVPMRPV